MTTEQTIDYTKLTPEILKAREVSADKDTLALLPFAYLTVGELDIVDEVLQLPEAKQLSISIGQGITYKSAYYGDECAVEAMIVAPGDCFIFPLTISIIVSHEPGKPSEHNEWCAYSWIEWPKDEEGVGYYVYDDGDWQYNEDTGEYFAHEGHRDYEPECNCEYYQDAVKQFVIKDESELAAVTEYIGLAVAGMLPEQEEKEEPAVHEEIVLVCPKCGDLYRQPINAYEDGTMIYCYECVDENDAPTLMIERSQSKEAAE